MRAAMVLKKINARGVQVGVMAVGTRNQIILSFFAASRLLPYWIGAQIWKIRSDPELAPSFNSTGRSRLSHAC